jgi:hypothetical protein
MGDHRHSGANAHSQSRAENKLNYMLLNISRIRGSNAIDNQVLHNVASSRANAHSQSRAENKLNYMLLNISRIRGSNAIDNQVLHNVASSIRISNLVEELGIFIPLSKP